MPVVAVISPVAETMFTKFDVPDVAVTLPATSPVKSPINVLATRSSPANVQRSFDSSHTNDTFTSLPLSTSRPALAVALPVALLLSKIMLSASSIVSVSKLVVNP